MLTNYNQTLTSHNTRLQSLIDVANDLPEAGSAGGGSEIETCSIMVSKNEMMLTGGAIGYDIVGYCVTILDSNNNITTITNSNDIDGNSEIIDNVVVGSIATIFIPNASCSGIYLVGATLLYSHSDGKIFTVQINNSEENYNGATVLLAPIYP